MFNWLMNFSLMFGERIRVCVLFGFLIGTVLQLLDYNSLSLSVIIVATIAYGLVGIAESNKINLVLSAATLISAITLMYASN